MTGRLRAHERFPEVIAAAVRVFARDGYRLAHMSDVARAAGLSEAAVYRYVDGKETLFALAIRHALLLEPLPGEDDPAGQFPLTAPSLAEMIGQARAFVAAEVPFGALAQALHTAEPADPAGELELIVRELFTLEEQTAQAVDMVERSARELPELADLLNAGLRRPVLDALTDYLESRAKTGALRATPDSAATALFVLETLTWFARHRQADPAGLSLGSALAQETVVDALLHALVPPIYLGQHGQLDFSDQPDQGERQ
jgi:AcrR family transcriptional regulator